MGSAPVGGGLFARGWGGAGPAGRQQSVTDPLFRRLASAPVLEAVQAASEGDLGGRLAAGLDVVAVDPDRRGAGEAGTLGRCLVADRAAGRVAVDQVCGGQGPQRLVGVQAELGGQVGHRSGFGWAGVGEEPGKQATVERAQRLG